MLLDNKTVLITGANGALGQSAARRAAALGAKKLVLVDVTPEIRSESVGCEVLEQQLDLTDAEATATFVATLDRVDVLLNIAGGFDMGPTTWEATDEQWQAMFNINVATMQNTVRACVPDMIAQGSGSIVNVGALGALQGQGLMSSYIASKSAVMRLTESLAAEVKDKGINVNAVLPNVIDTPRNRGDMPDADYSLWVDPDDLANVMCMLGSDMARAMHGALVPVSGLG